MGLGPSCSKCSSSPCPFSPASLRAWPPSAPFSNRPTWGTTPQPEPPRDSQPSEQAAPSPTGPADLHPAHDHEARRWSCHPRPGRQMVREPHATYLEAAQPSCRNCNRAISKPSSTTPLGSARLSRNISSDSCRACSRGMGRRGWPYRREAEARPCSGGPFNALWATKESRPAPRVAWRYVREGPPACPRKTRKALFGPAARVAVTSTFFGGGSATEVSG